MEGQYWPPNEHAPSEDGLCRVPRLEGIRTYQCIVGASLESEGLYDASRIRLKIEFRTLTNPLATDKLSRFFRNSHPLIAGSISVRESPDFEKNAHLLGAKGGATGCRYWPGASAWRVGLCRLGHAFDVSQRLLLI